MRPSARLIVLALGALCLAGCGRYHETRWVDGHWLTVYSKPGRPRIGQNLMAIRVQDRDYRILAGLKGMLQVRTPGGAYAPPAALKPGAGRDYLARASFPDAGTHPVLFTLWEADGQTITAEFVVRAR